MASMLSEMPNHSHRNVSGGPWRAAIFGVSDGLVSNVSLILGVVGAQPSTSFVRLAGLAGLLSGAFSMAAGEYISIRAQNDLLDHELNREKSELARNAENERRELAATYVRRGVDPDLADKVSAQLMVNPEIALEVHAQEELGVIPGSVPSPFVAAGSSFAAFVVGAAIPLVPWFFSHGTTAVLLSIVLSAITAAAVGWALGTATGGRRVFFAARQLSFAACAAGVTYAVGSLIGVSTS